MAHMPHEPGYGVETPPTACSVSKTLVLYICRLQGSGWPKSMYGVSKLCETAYTRVLAEQLKAAGVMVNACCPGYVDTDMTSHKGVKTLEQGADTPVWLALMPPGGPTGKLFAERKQIPF